MNAFVSGGFVPSARRGSSFDGLFSIADWYATFCDLLRPYTTLCDLMRPYATLCDLLHARYATFCELAGADPYDYEANATNLWLAARQLPLLPPVDGVAQWAHLTNGTSHARSEIHLSSNALIVQREP